jgi:hypothetical protein
MHLIGRVQGGCRKRWVAQSPWFGAGTNERVQALKRHAELGYLALVTGLKGVRLPGDVPVEEWDTWHSQIVNDELSRIVGFCAGERWGEVLTVIGVFGCELGSWGRKWDRGSADCELRHRGAEGKVPPGRCGGEDHLLPRDHRA